jgi:septum formation protein
MSAIVLASSSPYRQALLARLCLPFETVSPDVDETPHDGEHPADLVKRLAHLKAQAGSIRRSNALVIGCDQCAVCGQTILGKPGNFEIAFQQLKQAAGRPVTFHTGLCLLDTATADAQIDDVIVTVRFRSLTDAQIIDYLRKEAPYHCAGSFMSEGLGIALIERFEGDDPNALIGLPLIRLVSMLAHAGVSVV